jgi:hypothetical protein
LVDFIGGYVVELNMSDEARPGLLDSRRIKDLEAQVLDLMHRVADIETRMEAVRNAQIVPPLLMPVLNVPYEAQSCIRSNINPHG